MTIPSLDKRVWRALEPGAPPPAAGITAGVFMAPILPGITDSVESLRRLMAAAVEAGAPYVAPIVLRLAPGVREWFLPHLSEQFPNLALQYCRLYQRTEAAPDYKTHTLGLARRICSELSRQEGPGKMERAPACAEEVQQLRLSL